MIESWGFGGHLCSAGLFAEVCKANQSHRRWKSVHITFSCMSLGCYVPEFLSSFVVLRTSFACKLDVVHIISPVGTCGSRHWPTKINDPLGNMTVIFPGFEPHNNTIHYAFMFFIQSSSHESTNVAAFLQLHHVSRHHFRLSLEPPACGQATFLFPLLSVLCCPSLAVPLA